MNDARAGNALDFEAPMPRTFLARMLAVVLVAAVVGFLVADAGGASGSEALMSAAAVLVVGGVGSWLVARSLRARTSRAVAQPGETPGGPDELTELDRALDRSRSGLAAAEDATASYELILSSMREGVLLADPSESVSFANGAFERLHGSVPDALSGLAPAGLREAAFAGARSGASAGLEVEVGSPARWLRAAVAPVGDDGSILITLRDVTAARRLEEVRRDFVTNASHELKTPAASIQIVAETIRDAAADDPSVLPRFAEQLEREAMRLSRIVADLLDLSRLESEPTVRETVALDLVVAEETDRSQDLADRSEVRLAVDVTPVRVSGSEEDLRLLVRNLVDNACRYTKPGGDVRVSVNTDGPVAVLTVADTGIGIPARDVPRVFERFYRVDRARSRDTGGTGLGLSLVKHVVEGHEGTITVDSDLGVGTTIEVRLPRLGD